MNKVKAFTLLETLIAMVMILSIGYTFFVTLGRIHYSLNPAMNYLGHLVAEKEFAKTDILVDYPENYEVSALILEKTTSLSSR